MIGISLQLIANAILQALRRKSALLNTPDHYDFHKRNGPFERFDAIYYINMDTKADRLIAFRSKLEKLGIETFAKRFSAVATPENHHIGCALSHRAIIAEAHRQGLNNVLVFEDDAIFHRDILNLLPPMLDKLRSIDWDIFYLGGHCWGKKGELVESCNILRRPEVITTAHAIAYNRKAFDRLLHDIPASRVQVKQWLKIWKGIDQYLSITNFKKILAEPMIVMQPEMFDQPDAPHRILFDAG